MNLFKKIFIGIAIGIVVFAGVSFGIDVFQKPSSQAKADSTEPNCNNRTVGNTATYNPFPLQLSVLNPTPNADGSCSDIPLLSHYNPVLGSVVSQRNITLGNNGFSSVVVYYNNGANPTTGGAITNPTANLDVVRSGNTYTIKGALKGGNANLNSSESRAGGDLTVNVPAGTKLRYQGSTTNWFPQANVRRDLIATTGNSPSDPIDDNSTNGVASNPIFTSFDGYTFPASNGVNLSYSDTNKDAVRDPNSPNTLSPGFLNYGYIVVTLGVTADNLPPVLPDQVITIPQGGTGDFRSYINDPTFRGTDPGNNVPLTFTTGTLTGLNGVNCTNNSTTGVITCTADANAPLTPDRTFRVTPTNSVNITGSPATYTVRIVAPNVPNLGITKSANPISGTQVNPGQTVTYTLNFTNTGSANASNVVITDVLDSKISFVNNSCTPAAICSYNAGNRTLTWNVGSLAAGASATGTFQATVNAGATGTISNRATIAATGVTPVDSNVVTHNILVVQPPVLPDQVITIPQGGTGDFRSYINDPTFRGTDPGNNVPLTFTTGTLTGLNGVNCTNNSTTGVITCTADANAPLTPDRTFRVTPTNSVNITGSPATYTVRIVAPQTPILGIIKSSSPATGSTVTGGQTVTYTLNFTNTGSASASNVVITDVLDSKISFVNNSCTPAAICSYNAGNRTLTWNVGSLAAGASATGTFQATVNAGATGTISNRATIAATGVTPVDSNVVTLIIGNPLTIVKTADVSTINPGQTINYTLTYRNTGSTNLTNVRITDVLDTKTTFVTGSCTFNPQNPNYSCAYTDNDKTLTATIGNLPAGGTGSISFKVTANAGATGSITNRATITSTETGPIDSNIVTITINPGQVIPLIPNLVITKSVSASVVNANDTVTYNINYVNTGNANATGVVITDVLDPKLTYVDASCTPAAQCSFNASTRTLTYTVGNLNIGASGSFNFKAKVNSDATGTIPNTGSIRSDQNPNPITSTVFITVTTVNNGLSIAKTASGQNFNPGDTITYSINYANRSGNQATGVVITDVLDPKLTYVDTSCTPNNLCTYDNSNKTLTWRIGNLDRDASGTVSFQAKVNANATGTIPNTGTIKSDQNPNPVTNTVTVNVNVSIKAILTVTPKVIYVNEGPVDVRISNIVDQNNSPIANATCKIDLTMSDGSKAQIITTSNAQGVCNATIGRLGGIFSTATFPPASGSGDANKLTSVLGVVKAIGTVTSNNLNTTTNEDNYTVISKQTPRETNRSGGWELITAATSGIVAMLGYIYYTNFTNKQGANFTPKRSQEGTQD